MVKGNIFPNYGYSINGIFLFVLDAYKLIFNRPFTAKFLFEKFLFFLYFLLDKQEFCAIITRSFLRPISSVGRALDF